MSNTNLPSIFISSSDATANAGRVAGVPTFVAESEPEKFKIVLRPVPIAAGKQPFAAAQINQSQRVNARPFTAAAQRPHDARALMILDPL
jgi:hypothetical protein